MTCNATGFFQNFAFCFQAGQTRVTALRRVKPRAMTPTPPPPSDGSAIPPRHRPNLADLNKNTGESDLWDLDDEDGPELQSKGELVQEPRTHAVPAPRDSWKTRTQPSSGAPEAVVPTQSFVRIAANKVPSPSKDLARLMPRPRGSMDLDDDLEDWVAPPVAPTTVEPPVVEPLAEPVAPPVEPAAEEPVPPSAEDESLPAAEEPAAPVPLRLKLNLSPVERIGMMALIALLLVGGGVLMVITFGRLPTEPKRVEASNFPIAGKLVAIRSADSYWRAPASDGTGSEIARRGTVLVPVVNLKVSGGPAAVRVIFRDSDGKVVGDVLTRAVNADSSLEVAATAGFEEVGMHAAYRTGQSKPWTVQLYEADSPSAPSQDFKKVFEMRISTARR